MMQGLIHALRLDGQGGAEALSWDRVVDTPRDHGLLWLHFDYSDEAAANWLQGQSGLHPLVVQALLDEDTRPRANEYPGGLFVSLRGVNMNPGQDPEDMVGIRLWLEPGLIISTRKRALMSIREISAALLEGHGPRTEAGVLVDLSRRLISRMNAVIEELEDRTSELDGEVCEGASPKLRNELRTLRRQIVTLKRYLLPQRDALDALQEIESTLISDAARLRFRESQEKLVRYIDDLNDARERVIVLYEEIVSQQGDLMNQRMYVLSLVAAVFLPLGFLTGLFGINIGGMPGVESPAAFSIFVVVLIVSTVLMLWYFKRKQWL